jgi:LysM repeat protein
MVKKRIIISCLILIAGYSFGQNRIPQYEEYINNYNKIAIDEMVSYGIPASITLAQGILESGAGKGRLAVEANNHFGIKCHKEWEGEQILHDDDELQECFRKYKEPRESFEDHSKFLTTRDRYASLFQLDITDYKGWAKGLKAAGYATDPNYPDRLIKIIEDYQLYKYDAAKAVNNPSVNPGKFSKQENGHKEIPKDENRTIDKGTKVYYSNKIIGEITPFGVHEVKKKNGTKYIIALSNDTFESIAEEFGLKDREIYSINDIKQARTPFPGEIVYIRGKKTKTDKAFHVVIENETIRDISQMYGIRLKSLLKRNDISEDTKLLVGQRIYLK